MTQVTSGIQKPSATWGEYNNIGFAVQQLLGKLQTSTLVKIIACTNSGGISPVGFVDVQPLVNQIDAQGNPVAHVTVYNVPYFRLQGGTNAIIIDPQPGDIGMCCFASRDISKVKSTRVQANPGSFRQFSMSDGLYVGGMLNGAPTQYVRFNASGITIHSPTAVTIDAPTVTIQTATLVVNATSSATITTPTFTVNGASIINGTLNQTGGGTATFSGTMTVTGDVTANGTSVHTHVHSGVTVGGGDTGVPV